MGIRTPYRETPPRVSTGRQRETEVFLFRAVNLLCSNTSSEDPRLPGSNGPTALPGAADEQRTDGTVEGAASSSSAAAAEAGVSAVAVKETIELPPVMLSMVKPQHLHQAPELLQQRYDTSQHYTWALSGSNAFKSSFFKDGSFSEDCEIVAYLHWDDNQLLGKLQDIAKQMPPAMGTPPQFAVASCRMLSVMEYTSFAVPPRCGMELYLREGVWGLVPSESSGCSHPGYVEHHATLRWSASAWCRPRAGSCEGNLQERTRTKLLDVPNGAYTQAVDWDGDGHSELILLQWGPGNNFDDPPGSPDGRHCWVRYFKQHQWQLTEQFGEANPFRDLRFQMNVYQVRPAFSVVDWDGDGDWDWLLQDDEGLWFLEFSAGLAGLPNNLSQPSRQEDLVLLSARIARRAISRFSECSVWRLVYFWVERRPSRHRQRTENRAMESRQYPGSDGKVLHGLKAAMMRRGIMPPSNDIINLGPPAIMLVGVRLTPATCPRIKRNKLVEPHKVIKRSGISCDLCASFRQGGTVTHQPRMWEKLGVPVASADAEIASRYSMEGSGHSIKDSTPALNKGLLRRTEIPRMLIDVYQVKMSSMSAKRESGM
ncbi:hypothetical protein AK812_SmicGene25194 [Symbiodinium microadriaticum]|uniref:Uncharacterized protein n=1 Tax=Symbiodinium microadriaticum TaxID=2951 RepID=A0A1Q9DCN5_SYMMI|nr:hypothetical protein AK812_SmicGene25194 [Symbiodinium microadriaticum]